MCVCERERKREREGGGRERGRGRVRAGGWGEGVWMGGGCWEGGEGRGAVKGSQGVYVCRANMEIHEPRAVVGGVNYTALLAPAVTGWS